MPEFFATRREPEKGYPITDPGKLPEEIPPQRRDDIPGDTPHREPEEWKPGKKGENEPYTE